MPDTNPEPLDQRFVVMMSRSDVERITTFAHTNRIFGRSEAARRILAAGFAALDQQDGHELAAAVVADDRPPPTFPTPDECGRPTLGEVILPWLRANPRREYELGDVVTGVFPDSPTAPGRDQAVTKLFKAIGWEAHTSRRGGETRRWFTAPAA